MSKIAIGQNGEDGDPLKRIRFTSLSDKEKGRRRQRAQVIEDLLDEHRRVSFFDGLRQDYANLKKDDNALAEEESESAIWDSTAGDNLEDE